jgi:hypothetical protein
MRPLEARKVPERGEPDDMSDRSQSRMTAVYERMESMGARRIERAVALADKVDRILASKPEDHEGYRHIGWLRDRLGIE